MTSAMTVHSHADSPSVVRHWLDKARRSIGLGGSHMTHVAHHSLHAVQQYGEAAVVGAICGYARANGLLQGKYPLELGLAAAGLVLPLLPVDSLKGVSADARNVGAAGAALYARDQAEAFFRAKKAGVHGDFGGEDPVLDAAARLKSL